MRGNSSRIDQGAASNYGNYMKSVEVKLARVGNSQGIRLPAKLIQRLQLEQGVVLQEEENQIILRPKKTPQKLSWEETAREMAAAGEDWSEWEALPDGWDAE